MKKKMFRLYLQIEIEVKNNLTADFVVIIVITNLLFILYRLHFPRYQHPETRMK